MVPRNRRPGRLCAEPTRPEHWQPQVQTNTFREHTHLGEMLKRCRDRPRRAVSALPMGEDPRRGSWGPAGDLRVWLLAEDGWWGLVARRTGVRGCQ
jgi:hypothetical protein